MRRLAIRAGVDAPERPHGETRPLHEILEGQPLHMPISVLEGMNEAKENHDAASLNELATMLSFRPGKLPPR
jgi:hypothetical protein